MSDWLVACDFDGTICLPDAGEHLLEEFGKPEWKELDEQVWRGELTEREAWFRQIEMLRCTWEDAREALRTGIQIRAGFAEFVQFCSDSKLPFVVLSSGLKPLIDAVFADAGLPDLTVLANDVTITGDRWQLLPYPVTPFSARCSHCKCVHMLRWKAEGKRIAYIGDGLTDVCPSAHADLLFATGSLARHCSAQSLPYLHFESFFEITSALRLSLDSPS